MLARIVGIKCQLHCQSRTISKTVNLFGGREYVKEIHQRVRDDNLIRVQGQSCDAVLPFCRVMDKYTFFFF
jgi:hypothetical protein